MAPAHGGWPLRFCVLPDHRLEATFIIVEIDGASIKSPKDLHRCLSAALNFGPYYQPNLSALWDRLTTDVERPVDVVWRNSRLSRSAMGEAPFEKLRSLLLRVQEQDASFGREERFSVRFE